MAHTRVYRNGTLEAEGFDPEKISDYLAEDGTLVWLDLCTDDGDHLSLISEELNLDGLAVEDALNRRQRPKVDRYPGHLFLTVYSVRVGETRGRPQPGGGVGVRHGPGPGHRPRRGVPPR